MEMINQINGTLSIDRVSLLVFSPHYCLWQSNTNESKQNEMNIKKMNQAILNLLPLDDDFANGSSTKVFLYHYRTKNGLDIQIGNKLPVVKKLPESFLIENFGTIDLPNDKKFIMDCSNYGIRIEYNPNKTKNLSEISSFLSYCCPYFSSIESDIGIKFSRVDIAIDYPFRLKPEFVLCSGMRKSCFFCGNSGIETVYFGSRSSKTFFRIYNKKIELSEIQQKEIEGDLWRIELESKKSFNFSNVPDFSKDFGKIILLDGGSSSGDWLLDIIKQNALSYGLTSVLNSIPLRTRQRYKKILSQKLNCVCVEHPSIVCEREFQNCFNKIKLDIFNSLKSKVVK
ncbi:MAG: replication initiation factor domain-containing protein [Arcobacteraceae bacterium]|nr:replication initiation factor domain-containing protein [Arcobacteraceae bacterium]